MGRWGFIRRVDDSFHNDYFPLIPFFRVRDDPVPAFRTERFSNSAIRMFICGPVFHCPWSISYVKYLIVLIGVGQGDPLMPAQCEEKLQTDLIQSTWRIWRLNVTGSALNYFDE
jgi:hypothetical protein